MTVPKSPRSGTVCMAGAKNSPPRADWADAEIAGFPAASSLKRSASLFLFARANLVFAAVNFIFPSAKILFTRVNIIFAAAKTVFARVKMIFARVKIVFTSAKTIFARVNFIFARAEIIFPSAKIIFTDAFGLGRRHKRRENQVICLFPARKWPGQGESAAATEGFGPQTRIRLPAATAGRSAARGWASGSPRNSRWYSGGWSSARRFPIPPPTRGPTQRGAARLAAR